MLIQYYTLWQKYVSSALPELIQQFEDSMQVANSKIEKYSPRDWRMYNEAKDSSYTDGYNQGLLEGHDNGLDEVKEYYQNIFERELRQANTQRKEGANNGDSENVEAEDEY